MLERQLNRPVRPRLAASAQQLDHIFIAEFGQVPIFEPGLTELVRSNASEGRLSFGTDLAQAVRGADAVFIAVGTPSRRGRR